MTNPTYLTQHYGPIVECVKGAQGHIRKNTHGYYAVVFRGEDVIVKDVEGLCEGREWIRAEEAA